MGRGGEWEWEWGCERWGGKGRDEGRESRGREGEQKGRGREVVGEGEYEGSTCMITTSVYYIL